MKTFRLKKGLDLPINGLPEQVIYQGTDVKTVAIIGDDFVGMKPTMEVKVGDPVITGQLLFYDKKNPGVKFTSPGCGNVTAINRGAKRKFESLVISLMGNKAKTFLDDNKLGTNRVTAQEIKELLIDSGLWASFRTRPFGKVPSIDSSPNSVFITATDSNPLAPPPEIIIKEQSKFYKAGLQIINQLFDCPIHYCTNNQNLLPEEEVEGFSYNRFTGPHPSGLASTHIHFIDPVHEHKTVWHIGYQDISAIGHLFITGQLMTERIISLAGPAVKHPRLIRTRLGASITDLCEGETDYDQARTISGSVLSGRKAENNYSYLARYDNQISIIEDSDGRSLFNWAIPGSKRFSFRPVFSSSLFKKQKFSLNSAMWGGKRAIYPLGVYDEVMPMDIIATSLLKSLQTCNTELARQLGALELVEEDLGLCGFVCPGKNEFGSTLRTVLTAIELGD